jgi:uncharacterized protein
MIAFRLVLDTNVIVSAALQPEGHERTVLLIALKRPAALYASCEILSEYFEVLGRRKFRISRGERHRIFQLVKNGARLIEARAKVRVSSDATDDKFLECAEAARADYLVTGNLKHFPRYWRNTKIVTSRELLEIISPHRPL